MYFINLSKLREDYKSVKKSNLEVADQLLVLIEYEKINLSCRPWRSKSGKRMKVHALCSGAEISLRTLQRWHRRYREGGVYGLARKRANGAQRTEIDGETKQIIRLMRKDYLWGAEVIQAHLKYDHGIEITQYKVNRFLDESGLKKEYPCLPTKKNRSKRKHTKVVKIHNPGEHTQMDVNHQRHMLEHKSYVYNFIDHASNWSYKRVYKSASPTSTIDFMKKVTDLCPFNIKCIQTDNGVEFTYKYISKYEDEPREHPLTIFCKKRKIKHRLIPPGEKELNGLVERSHRQDKQELLHRITPKDLDEFNGEIAHYADFRNKRRRFKKLGWKTPHQWLDHFTVYMIAVYLIYNEEKKRRKYKRKQVKETAPKENLSQREQLRAVRRILTYRNKKGAA